MSFSRPIQWYHSHADPIWPDGTFKAFGKDLSRLNPNNTGVQAEDKVLKCLTVKT